MVSASLGFACIGVRIRSVHTIRSGMSNIQRYGCPAKVRLRAPIPSSPLS